jgi:hypothetical protein
MASETDVANAQLTAGSGSGEPIVIEMSLPASANDSTRFFDFFGLPRELRDKIYEQPVLFEYEHLPTNGQDDLISKVKKLRTSLLQMSRQFRDEYTERCAGQQVLCMRDHCQFWADHTLLPSPNRACFWAIEYFVMPHNTLHDLMMLKEFLNLRAGPDLALRSIDIKLLFMSKASEDIESGEVRRAISELQAFGRVASLEIYLAEKLWDFRKSGKPRVLIASWDRSDDTHINFLKPAMEIHDIGSEWGHPSDINPECCDPTEDLPTHGNDEGDKEDQSDSRNDGEDDNKDEGEDGGDDE